MSVGLLVELPSGVVSVEADGSNTIAKLKEDVAASAGLQAAALSLTFEGLELADASMVCEHPLESGSSLVAVVSKNHAVKMKLEDLGWVGCNMEGFAARVQMHQSLPVSSVNASDARYARIFELLCEICEKDTQWYKGVSAAISGLEGKGFPQCTEAILDSFLPGDVGMLPQMYADSVLRTAASTGRTSVARELLEHGAVHTALNNEMAALHLAAVGNHVDVVQLLLEDFADVFAITQNGNTALHLAACSGCTEAARVLVSHDSTLITITNNDNESPADLARRHGHTSLADLLQPAAPARPVSGSWFSLFSQFF
eukprot:TRINITY_DN4757_c0_g1_i1.p2 TRINITY_DN4757_c0_g1~~TRINITY_DN4757_c0_g1_i1.p2  ORF type:complete len:314 (+),score=60.48 TRINITY_DN4757_c0_g1_i1:1018-1959(+)